MNCVFQDRAFLALACGIALFSTGSVAAELPQTGTISGVITLQGDIPSLPPLVKKNDATAKDAAVCAASTIPDESLLVDQKSKGIANVFVFLRKRPANLAEDQRERMKPVVLEQKGCRYLPRTMIVRTHQEVKVINRDEIARNAHDSPISNPVVGVLIQPDPVWEYEKPEILPIRVDCDIHPWMKAWMLVVDHPFAAVTDKDGKFQINGLPEGDYGFWFWHERSGWLEKKYKVEIKAGEETPAALRYTADRFKK